MMRECGLPFTLSFAVGVWADWKKGVGGWESFTDIIDRYPPRMIPGVDISVNTTATNDKDARLLLSSMGIPFFGKHIN